MFGRRYRTARDVTSRNRLAANAQHTQNADHTGVTVGEINRTKYIFSNYILNLKRAFSFTLLVQPSKVQINSSNAQVM
jgi:hypothetical protein